MRQQQISVIISEPQTQICVSKETDKKIKKKNMSNTLEMFYHSLLITPKPMYNITVEICS